MPSQRLDSRTHAALLLTTSGQKG